MISVLALLILGADVPVPQICTPEVNAKLAQFVLAPPKKGQVANVMVCGVAADNSHTERRRRHSDQQVVPLHTIFPGGVHRVVGIVTDDALDGKITTSKNAVVFAYGQPFVDRLGAFHVSLRNVGCARKNGLEEGWLVVNGAKTPVTACGGTAAR